MSSPPPPPHSLVWFLLLDSATGEFYKGTSADAVSLPPGSDVVDLCDALIRHSMLYSLSILLKIKICIHFFWRDFE